MEGKSGFSLNTAGVKAVNDYFILRKTNNGSLPNSTSTLTKSFAGGINANTQYMSCPTNTTINFTTSPFTWLLWVKTSGQSNTFIGKGQGGPAFVNYLNLFYFQKYGTTQIVYASGQTGNWQLARCWYDGTNYYLQINNGAIVSAALAGGFTSNVGDLRVAAPYNASDQSLTGQASRIWQWSRVLTTDEATSLYNSGSGRSFLEAIYYTPSLVNGLVSYWPLNEKSGTSDGRDLYGTNTLIAKNNPTVTTGIIEEIL
jgi:hypothetical protein